MSIDFWTSSNFNEFWTYVRMLLETINPGIMLVFAVVAAGFLIGVVVKIYKEATNKDDKPDDDDFEVRHY